MRATFANRRAVRYSEIREELRSIGFKEGRLEGLELNLVGISILDDQGGGEIFSFGGQSRLTDKWDQILVAGSGSEHFIDQLSRVKGIDTKDLKGPFLWVLTCGCVLMEELRSGNTLKNYYGGGFDFAVPEIGEIRKISNVTYCFWFVKDIDQARIRFAFGPLIIKTSYVGEYMVIKRLSFGGWRDNTRGESRGRAELERYVVRPLFGGQSIDLAQAMSRDMMSPIVCSMVLFGVPGDLVTARLDYMRPDVFRIEGGGRKSAYYDLVWSDEYFESMVSDLDGKRSSLQPWPKATT